MIKSKQKRLHQNGWKVGDAQEFLELSSEEARYIELKLALSNRLRERREARKMSQVELARHLHSSQSRVAKMEAGDPSVSLDLLVRSLFSLGSTNRNLAEIISTGKLPRVDHRIGDRYKRKGLK